jgi:hypothetical protein
VSQNDLIFAKWKPLTKFRGIVHQPEFDPQFPSLSTSWAAFASSSRRQFTAFIKTMFDRSGRSFLWQSTSKAISARCASKALTKKALTLCHQQLTVPKTLRGSRKWNNLPVVAVS